MPLIEDADFADPEICVICVLNQRDLRETLKKFPQIELFEKLPQFLA